MTKEEKDIIQGILNEITINALEKNDPLKTALSIQELSNKIKSMVDE